MTSNPTFPNLFVLDHPLIQHKLSKIRNKSTKTPEFRLLLREISVLMGYEATRHLKTVPVPLESPIAPFIGQEIKPDSISVISILRAGLGMADGLMDLIPTAVQGHIGLYRDPVTKRPVEYMVKLPKNSALTTILVDPMLATGHSLVYAADLLKKHGIKDHDIIVLVLVSAPEGIRVFQGAHPNIPIYTASVDDGLNGNAYIVPGLGDAGDRLFGTA